MQTASLQTPSLRGARTSCGVFALSLLLASSGAQAHIVSPFADDYQLVSLGMPPGVPVSYAAVVFDRHDSDVLLIGGSANSGASALYRIEVVRDPAGHVTGFAGPAVPGVETPFLDGGASYHPQRTLFVTRYPVVEIGQVLPGSAITDRVVSLLPFGLTHPVTGLSFVPNDYPGAGQLKLLSYSSGSWYTASITADGPGLFDITEVTLQTVLGAGYDAMAYVPPGSPEFDDFSSVLITNWDDGTLTAFPIDENGDPIFFLPRPFANLMPRVEGIAADPVTGDFIVASSGLGFGPDRVWVVRGFGLPISVADASWGSIKGRYRK